MVVENLLIVKMGKEDLHYHYLWSIFLFRAVINSVTAVSQAETDIPTLTYPLPISKTARQTEREISPEG